ncbi:hypothetical protein JW998_04595 [candidate division KSB1 bacterium]|nr:hypothetical protein [candidate division KSB1 bacterium]
MSLKMELRKWLLILAASLFTCSLRGQIADAPDDSVAGIPVNYTEARVGDYTLPDPLICTDGQRVRDVDTWIQKRRGEIVRLFEEHQFGTSPAAPKELRFALHEQAAPAFGEFLAAVAAEPVYELFGKDGLNTDEMPPADTAILNDIGFYLHDGGHGNAPSDWQVILEFLQKYLKPEN